MSNTIFLLALEVAWDRLAQRLNLTPRSERIADGRIDGHNYTVIQRDGQIYFVMPDFPRGKCHEMMKKILQQLQPGADIDVKTFGMASASCNYCLNLMTLPYRCKRCRGWYCQDHRLPEKHNCPGDDDGSKTLKKRSAVDKQRQKKDKETIVAVELPCG